VPSNVSGAITWVAGQPTGTGLVTPTAEVWSNASTPTPFTIAFDIYDAAGVLVGSASGQGTAAPNAVTVAAPAQPVVTLPGATLWHLVQPPLKPYLYRLVTTLSLAGAPVQAKNTTFGIRRTRWDAATGFYLNDQATKILGTANHQDYAGMGVAFPDHLQWNRVAKLLEIGVNGWRTAHNPPTPSLLDAMDELGMVCWDENHRNGQFDQVPLLVRRDRK
jgi:beta-galactosidase